MSTDEMIQQQIDNPQIPEFGAQIPYEQPAQPKPRRKSSVFPRLRAKLAKGNNLVKASAFAQILLKAGTRTKIAVKSVKLQHGISTRKARELVNAAKPRKHRARA